MESKNYGRDTCNCDSDWRGCTEECECVEVGDS